MRTRRFFVVFAIAVICASGSQLASASAGISLAVTFPAAVTAGDTGVAANLDFRNISTPNTLTISVGSIKLTPSCATYVASTCTSVDNGVFAIGASGIGRANTACAGVAFSFVPHAGATDGSLDVLPGSAVVLGTPGTPNGGDRCIVDFTFAVAKVPAKDAQAANPGRQTSPGAIVNGTASDASAAVVFVNTFVTVQQVTPSVVTTASAGVIAGGSVTDSALMSGGANPTGTLTFRLYGPADTTCTSAAIFTKAVTVAGNGTYVSTAFVTTVAGTHRWIATYGGDASNVAVAGACSNAGESVVVTAASPTLTTVASASVKVGTAISDSATLALGTKPTGTITYTLYGPDDATCATAPVFTTTKVVNGNAKYTSAAFTPTQPGTYRWIAAYGGNAANNPVSGACNDAGESVVITKVTPTLATTASATGALGTAVTDTATLAAGFAPTGTLTFVLYAANDTTCASVLFTSDPIAINGNGTYASTPAYTPAAVATYRWRAFYSGDANNVAVSGACGAARESVVIAKVTTVVDTIAAAGGAIGTILSDSATLSGGLNPTGNFRFRAYGPNDPACANAAVYTSAVITVNGNGTYASSPNFTPATAGTYRWRATYSGDVNNAAATGACNAAGETSVINQATPALATSASAGGAIGTTLTDQASLGGGTNPKGTLTFALYGPNDAVCATAAFTSNAITVNGNGDYTSAPAFATGAAGTYRWRAFYSGDVNNAAVSGACNAANEAALIVPMTPALVTTASPGGPIGTPLLDQATLGGGLGPTGTIDFFLYGPNDATCAGAPAFTSAGIVVNGNGVYTSVPFAPPFAGVYRWRAVYSGDFNNAPAAGACNDAGETAAVSVATPSLATSASADIFLGGSVMDSATLSGGVAPTGALVFRLYGPDDASCTTLAFTSGAVSVNGNGVYASAPPFTPTAAGAYRWVVAYGGDVNNAGVAGVCGVVGESVAVSRDTPSIATTASAGGTLGTALSDQAMLSGGFNPGGTITFNLYGPDDAICTGAPVFVAAAAVVNGNGTYASAPFTPTLAGTYRWRAIYSGDGGNVAVAGACNAANESAAISRITPTLVTTASIATKLGSAITDNAVLASGAAPSGTMTFTLYGPNDSTCAGPPVFTASTAVAGNGAYSSSPFTPPGIGTYRWIANYGGDANNAPVTGACNDAGELSTINLATPTLVTAASAAVKLGTQVSDSATLAAGINPGGSITFNLYGPADVSCAGAPMFTSVITVAANGTYPSMPFTPTAVGTYRWIASYGGDASNAPVAGNCGDAGESVGVSQAAPTIATNASAGGAIGVALHDVATLAGGMNPTGTLTFTAYGPDDATCTNVPTFTSAPVSVNGNGNYDSAPLVPDRAGTFRWRASYSGDAGNAAVAGACNDPNERATITASTPTVAATAVARIVLGGSIHDEATLAGGTNPTGTITFSLYGPNDAACSRAPIFSASVSVTGNGVYVAPSFTPLTAGTYRWIAAYAGDANNGAITGACNDAGQTSVAIAAPLAAQDVDTLSRWALALLSLVLAAMATAAVAIRKR